MQSRKWTNHPNFAIETALPGGCPRPATAAGASRVHGAWQSALDRGASSNGPMPQSACGERRLAMITAGRCGAPAYADIDAGSYSTRVGEERRQEHGGHSIRRADGKAARRLVGLERSALATTPRTRARMSAIG
jgi:hypothetical protein